VEQFGDFRPGTTNRGARSRMFAWDKFEDDRAVDRSQRQIQNCSTWNNPRDPPKTAFFNNYLIAAPKLSH
jgi:hypothetical protein